MKKLLFVLALALLAGGISAQRKSEGDRSFQKGDQLCEAGIGFAFYGQSEITWKNQSGPEQTEKDTVGSMNFPVRYLYGVLDWLGVGGMFRFHNYIEGDSNNTDARAVGFDIGLRADAHYLRTRRMDFSGALGFGYSHGDWRWNDGFDTHVYGSGTHFDFDLIFRFYFSDHFGMSLSYGRTFQTFPKVVGENSGGFREEYTFRFRGAEYMFGLQVKL